MSTATVRDATAVIEADAAIVEADPAVFSDCDPADTANLADVAPAEEPQEAGTRRAPRFGDDVRTRTAVGPGRDM